MKRIYHFLSKDMKTRIRTVLYTPEGMPAKAVVQIAHGMSEHIDRYNEFALYLKNHGFIVVGHDHLGHGKSISSDNNLGYFSPRPSQDLINDMHQVRVNVQKLFPDKPYFMLGHSMGSYLLRQYLSIYGEGLDGALILGTGYVSPLLARTGIGLAKLLALFNFSDQDETAWINEEGDYRDLMTGESREAKAVGVPAQDFVWLLTKL